MGAEAKVYLGRFLDLDVVEKVRLPKRWRVPQLDLSLRQFRTRHEAKLIHAARRAGAPVPPVLLVDLSECSLVMLYLDGPLLRTALARGDLSINEAKSIFRLLGMYTGRLHLSGIIHGDLTTSNVILYKGRPVLIDFGLGDFTTNIEDFGTELVVLEVSVKSAHHEHAEELIDSFIEGYAESAPELVEEVTKRAREIKMRARYVEERRIRRFRRGPLS